MTYDMKRVIAIRAMLQRWFAASGHEIDSSFAIIGGGEVNGQTIEGVVIDLHELAEYLDEEINK